MRILPGNFASLEEQYIVVAAQMICDYKVSADLAYGQDETNAQFVSRPNKTRAEKGSKRIRLLGVGAEKPQITVTFSLEETGEVVGLDQMIFGGKKKRCVPQNPDHPDYYYDNSENPATYMTYLEKVVMPDRNATIARLHLPPDQKALVVCDLHYSHKDSDVLEFMKENNLLSLYIPAGCTDVMQTCDTVANKPFKVGLRAASRDFLYAESPDKEARGQWDPKLTMGALKEKITGFVSVGMDALKTPEMKISIAKAFARDGCFAIIRSAER
jgi:DDE superfamily endonuclease